jgi:hypothetical protein
VADVAAASFRSIATSGPGSGLVLSRRPFSPSERLFWDRRTCSGAGPESPDALRQGVCRRTAKLTANRANYPLFRQTAADGCKPLSFGLRRSMPQWSSAGIGSHQRSPNGAEQPQLAGPPAQAARTIRTGDSDCGRDAHTAAVRRSSRGWSALQAVALLGLGVGRVEQWHAAL